MRKRLIFLAVTCLATALVVAAAFGQGGRERGQGRGGERGRGGSSSGIASVVADGKIFVLKEKVIYKIDATTMKVTKKKEIDFPMGEMDSARFLRMISRVRLTVDGKHLFAISYNAVYKININTLELAGTIQASDLISPEEEKKEKEEKEKGEEEDGDFKSR